MFFKNLCVWVLIISAVVCDAQILRFDPMGSSIGIQTPHEWNIYAHSKVSISTVMPTITAWSSTSQLGYVWYLAERGGIRSSAQLTYWGIFDNIYYYYEIIPIGICMYPFAKEYFGIDLELSVPPTFPETRVNATFLIRF